MSQVRMRSHVRLAQARGSMRNSWLDARFSFSFGPYRDPEWDRFGTLLALNEDFIEPGTGFDMHPHKDLEIFLIPLTEPVLHEDSLGNRATVNPGEIQKLRAGRGIWHSQKNGSRTGRDHHLQIWIEPRTRGLTPSIEQKAFDPAGRLNRWQVLISPDGREGSLSVDQDALLHAASISSGACVMFNGGARRRARYVHIVRGAADVWADGAFTSLHQGDAWLSGDHAGEIEIFAGRDGAEVLLFDLAAIAAAA